jgi:hypothetical protein
MLTLRDIRGMFTIQDEELLHLVQTHVYRLPRDFLWQALNEEPYDSAFGTLRFEEHEQAIASGIKMRFLGDYIQSLNHAWLWAHSYQPCELYVKASRQFANGEGLRRFGYVFWDSDRLHASGILQQELVCSQIRSVSILILTSPADVSKAALAKFSRPVFCEESVEDRVRKLWQQTLQVSEKMS